MGPSLFRLLPWREEGPTREQGKEVRDAISQTSPIIIRLGDYGIGFSIFQAQHLPFF